MNEIKLARAVAEIAFPASRIVPRSSSLSRTEGLERLCGLENAVIASDWRPSRKGINDSV